MQIVNLPHDLNLQDNTFNIMDYQTSKDCFRQMVSLQQNTFSFLMEGKKEVFAENTSLSIDSSSFLLMKTGNCLMTETLPNSIDNYRSILFFFSEKAIIQFIQKHKINHSNSTKSPTIHAFEYDHFLKTFVNGLIDISTLQVELQSKLLALKFEELMLYLVETRGVHFLLSLVNNIDNQQQHFIKVVETNTLHKLTIAELAFLSNMSISTFKREFQKHFHTSPSKWFQEKRLEHAAFLLKQNTQRPSDIFEEIGYENLSNFIQAFKTKYGMTPKQYQLNLDYALKDCNE